MAVSRRVLLLASLLGFQALALVVFFPSHSLKGLHSGWATLTYEAAGELRMLSLYFGATLLILLGPRLAAHLRELEKTTRERPWIGPLLVQCGAFLVTVLVTWTLFTRTGERSGLGSLLLAGWLAAIGLTLAAWLNSLAPRRYWIGLLSQEKFAFVLALVLALGMRAVVYSLMRSWAPLSGLTLRSASALLGLFYSGTFLEPATQRFGTAAFDVTVAPACSGYEGMGVAAGFVAAYITAFRKDLRFPEAFALLPIAVAASWLLNVLRLTALVAIGSSLSPEIAMQGFHARAGWMAFIAVAAGVVLLSHRAGFARQPVAPAGQRQWLDAESALLIPLLTLLGSTLLTSAFSAGFEWLYPLRVLATGLALAACWKHLGLGRYAWSLAPVALGALAFAAWLVLIPDAPGQSAEFAFRLSQASPSAQAAWLAVRCVGAAVTVPLAEELAFRGYLPALLSGKTADPRSPVRFGWPAFLGSSAMFGALHGHWFAGTLAGVIYSAAVYRRGRLEDAAVAHMTTNLMLALYVLATQRWSYW